MKTVDISGMGGEYENTCQKIIKVGLEFLKNYKEEIPETLVENSEFEKEFEAAIIKEIDDCTGAMFYTSRAHAWIRFKKGEEWYFNEFKDEPNRIYEWDGTVDSIPKNMVV